MRSPISRVVLALILVAAQNIFAADSLSAVPSKNSHVLDAAGKPSLKIELEESHDAFANPHMGWQTFHRCANDDPYLQGIPSGSAYYRFYWREIEPVEGQIDFALFDKLLAEAKASGQKLALRIMLAGSEYYQDVPLWLKAPDCKGFEFRYEQDQIVYRKLLLGFLAISIFTLLVWLLWKFWTTKNPSSRRQFLKKYAFAHLVLVLIAVVVWTQGGAKHWIPDYDDPRFQTAHQRLIRELGRHLDTHPDFDFIDIGSVGLWAEWHMAHTPRVDTGENVSMPPESIRMQIVDQYCAAFPHTPKPMLLNDVPVLIHAIEKGCGWRADSFGDMGGDSKQWSHMETLYPKWLAAAHADEAWKLGPVAFESAWDMNRWKGEGWDIRAIFDWALNHHVSYVNNKSAPLPDGTLEEVRRFATKMGYRLVLRSLTHPERVARGSALSLSMSWENVGVAPPYRDSLIAIKLSDAASHFVLTNKTSVKGWLPGAKEVSESFALPPELKAGTYTLSLALVDPITHEPVIHLANVGAEARAWFPLSKIEFTAP